MHMLTMTVSGLVLLAVFFFGGRLLNRRGNAVNGSWIFIWVWLAVSVVNGGIGVIVAGYSIATELAVHIVIFGVPAVIA
jgi:hypothetical protein